jgi:hypothetical protein
MDAIELLDELDEDQRNELLKPIFENLTQISHYVILEYQLNWNDKNGSFKEFVKGQNDVIKECIRAEMTGFGKHVREGEGLTPLENLTELF